MSTHTPVDAREELAESLWPAEMGSRGPVRAAASESEARRLVRLLQLLSADAGTVAAVRQFRRDARRGEAGGALGGLRRALERRYRSGVPAALFGGRLPMRDPRLGARILSAVFARRQRGLPVLDPDGIENSGPAAGAVVGAVREVVAAHDGASGLACLARALADPDWHVRAGGIRVASGFLGHRRIRMAWARMADDEDARVRALAVRRLAGRAGRPAVDALIRDFLADPEASVRLEAVRAAARSGELRREIALMAFDPQANVADSVRAILSSEDIMTAVDEGAALLAAGEAAPEGVLRIVYRDAGISAVRVGKIARRRVATLNRVGQVSELASAARSLRWISAPEPATVRLACKAIRTPGLENAALVLTRSWPGAAGLEVGLARLSTPAGEGPSQRAYLCEILVGRAVTAGVWRQCLLDVIPKVDRTTAGALLWAIAGAFPEADVSRALELARSRRQDAELARTIEQVTAGRPRV